MLVEKKIRDRLSELALILDSAHEMHRNANHAIAGERTCLIPDKDSVPSCQVVCTLEREL